jgi:hypothetical protein
MKEYTRFSGRAGLAITGIYMQQEGIWDEVTQRVKIRQKIIQHSPQEKLMDALINILAGGGGLNEINHRVRPDEGIQCAFGRHGCAEQSTVSETLNACGAEQIEQMNAALCAIYRRHSRGYRHNYERSYQLLDIDHTGLLAGAQAEGATSGYFAGQRNGRGRQLGRVIASWYDEIVYEKLYDGKTQLEKSLGELMARAEQVLALTPTQRQRTIVRVDGGGGTDLQLNWLLERGYHILAKVKNWQRTQKLVKTVRCWVADDKVADREFGWVENPHSYVRPTRQLAVRWKEKGGWHYRVLVTTLSDEVMQECLKRSISGLIPTYSSQLIAYTYDLRSGGIETNLKGSKAGLGLTKRNKRKFFAQEMLVLLAQLAANLIVWVRDYCPTLHKFGMLRMIRDAFHIPGKLTMDSSKKVIRICLNIHHGLSPGFVHAYRELLEPSQVRLYLGKI